MTNTQANLQQSFVLNCSSSVPMFIKIYLNPYLREGPSDMIYLRDLLLDLSRRLTSRKVKIILLASPKKCDKLALKLGDTFVMRTKKQLNKDFVLLFYAKFTR